MLRHALRIADGPHKARPLIAIIGARQSQHQPNLCSTSSKTCGAPGSVTFTRLTACTGMPAP